MSFTGRKSNGDGGCVYYYYPFFIIIIIVVIVYCYYIILFFVKNFYVVEFNKWVVNFDKNENKNLN